MTDPDTEGKSSSRVLWIVILVLFLVLVIGWFANPFGKMEPGEPAALPSMPPDLAEKPNGPAVDVTLPKTPMTNVPAEPAEGAAPAASPTG